MTAKIFKFSSSDGTLPHHRTQDKITVVSERDIFDKVLELWQEAARNNQLQEMIRLKLPAHASPPLDYDCVNDLNVIADIEKKLDMRVSLFSPGETEKNPTGWLATFTINGKKVESPRSMATEANARTLNMLLFVEFNRQLILARAF